MSIPIGEVQQVRTEAELLFSESEIEAALARMAGAIAAELADKNPLMLTIMVGGMLFAGELAKRMPIPMQLDYLHVTRYRGATSGGEVAWLGKEPPPLAGRHLLIVDDILDEGHTLKAIVDFCYAQRAASVATAVLLDKHGARKAAIAADHVGFACPSRYVFGFGMDYKGYWRNLPAIYAVRGK